MRMLELVRETKLHTLLPWSDPDSPLEASGVIVQGDRFIIIFDNLAQAASITASCSASDDNQWLGDHNGARGHEDIAYNPRLQRFYGLIEAVPDTAETHYAEVVEYDHDFKPLARGRLPFAFTSANKGFEGLAIVHRGDEEYLLALCEGNRCLGGEEGKRQGHGRIQRFQRVDGKWRHVDTIKLPTMLRFTDYASLDIAGNRVVILSQQSARLWIGVLDPESWTFADDGVVWRLPRGERGKALYCHAEGVSWLTSDQLVVVSDKWKSGDPRRCLAQDQSVHVFRVPSLAGAADQTDLAMKPFP